MYFLLPDERSLWISRNLGARSSSVSTKNHPMAGLRRSTLGSTQTMIFQTFQSDVLVYTCLLSSHLNKFHIEFSNEINQDKLTSKRLKFDCHASGNLGKVLFVLFYHRNRGYWLPKLFSLTLLWVYNNLFALSVLHKLFLQNRLTLN